MTNPVHTPPSPEMLQLVHEETQRIFSTDPKPTIDATQVNLLHQGMDPRRMLALQHTEGYIVPVFTSAAFARDYSQFAQLKARQVALKIRDIHKCLPALERLASGLVINPCLRCGLVTTMRISELAQKGPDVLLWAVISTVAIKSVMARRELQRAQSESGTGKRLEILLTIRDHIDPGMPVVHREIGRIALLQEDWNLLNRCRSELVNYDPIWLNQLESCIHESPSKPPQPSLLTRLFSRKR